MLLELKEFFSPKVAKKTLIVYLVQSGIGSILLGAGLIALIYLPVLNSYFLGEDYAWWRYVKGKNIFEVLRFFIFPPSKALAGWYHPLVGLFYWLNVNFSWSPTLQSFGDGALNPLGFHLTNLALHIGVYFLVVALAYFFFKKILPRRQAGWPALLAGFLFSIFPFHSEAVAWIDGRHDLLMTFFYLLSFYLFLRWNEDKKRVLLGFSVFSFFLALAAKEMAVTLPLALMVYLWTRETPPRWRGPSESEGRHLGGGIAWFWLVLVFYFFLHAAYVGHFNPFGAASHMGVIISRVLVFYLIFLGISLVFFFLTKKTRLRQGFVGQAKIWDQRHLKLIPLLAILIGVFYFPAGFTFTEERYLYLPSSIACIFLANLFFLFWDNKLFSQRRVARVALIFVLISASAVSVNYLVNRIYDWKKAGEIAQKVVNEFKSYSGEIPEDSTIYLLNLPDNYHGSYIFRTHTAEAIKYGTGREFKKMIVLPRVLGVGESSVEVVDKSHFVLKNQDGYLIFTPTISQILPSGKPIIETDDYRLLVEGVNTLGLTLKTDYLGKEGVFFFEYQDGRIKIVDSSTFP